MKSVLVAASLAAVGLLSGCSSHNPTPAQAVPPAAMVDNTGFESAKPPDPQVLHVGDKFTVWDRDNPGSKYFDITLEDVKYQPVTRDECGQPTPAKVVGLHLLVDATDARGQILNQLRYKERYANGNTSTGDISLSGCTLMADGSDLVESVDAGQKQDGWVLLEVRESPGIVIFGNGATSDRQALINYQ